MVVFGFIDGVFSAKKTKNSQRVKRINIKDLVGDFSQIYHLFTFLLFD